MKVLKFVIGIVFLFLLVFNSYAVSTTMILVPAKNCQDLTCVRKNIDAIDTQLVTLIGLRLEYVKRAGEIKKNQISIHDQARENKILDRVKQQAKKAGYPVAVIVAVFQNLLQQTNIFEQQVHNQIKNK